MHIVHVYAQKRCLIRERERDGGGGAKGINERGRKDVSDPLGTIKLLNKPSESLHVAIDTLLTRSDV